MFCPLTASMQFLHPPPVNGNCYKIGTRHAREVSLGSCKVGISVGGWGILQKTCDLALKITKIFIHYLQIVLPKKLLVCKNFSEQSCPDMSRL